MGAVFFVLSLFYIAYRLGKEDGRWGLFIGLVILMGIGAIGAAVM